MSNADRSLQSPFNTPLAPATPPYHLRNGIGERAEIDRHEAEHKRRLGMPSSNDRERFETWVTERVIPTLHGVTIERGEHEYTHIVTQSMWAAWQAALRP